MLTNAGSGIACSSDKKCHAHKSQQNYNAFHWIQKCFKRKIFNFSTVINVCILYSKPENYKTQKIPSPQVYCVFLRNLIPL